MIVTISPRAYTDLEEIKSYISDSLQASDSAKIILSDILKSIRSLNELPERGAPLDTIIDVKTDYRFIQSHNYIIFYRVEGTCVFISRVLYKHRNFLKVFFSDSAFDNTESET